MTWRAAIAVALLTTLASPARAVDPSDWRACLPAEWLAVAVIDSPDSATTRIDELLRPWDRRTDWLRTRFDAFFPDSPFADRPWVVALVEGEDGTAAPMLLAPTDDFAALCETLGADVADEIAVAMIGGFDIALMDRGGWAQVTLLDSTPTAESHPADPEIAILDRLADCEARLAVSSRGLDRLADELEARRWKQLKSGRGRVPRWAWPVGFNAFVERLAQFAPIAEPTAGLDEPLALGLRQNSKRAWVASVVLPIETTPPDRTPPALPAGEPIASLRFGGQLPADLIDLAIAGLQCRPVDIDAPEYPQPQWDDLAEAYRHLLSGCRSASYGLMLPAEGEPVAANQVSVFAWEGGAEQLGETLAATVVRWNQVVNAAKARTPLRVAIEPLEAQPLGKPGGWRLSTDLFSGFAIDRSPEIEALFERCYGGDTLSLDVKPTGDGAWLARMGPPKDNDTGPALTADPPVELGVFLTGELRLDRWLAWQQQVEDSTIGEAIGRKVRPPMAETPPATLRATGGDHLRLDATLPAKTYEAAVRHWRAEKIAP